MIQMKRDGVEIDEEFLEMNENDGFENEHNLHSQINVQKEFKLSKSAATCKLSDIDGFVFGGMSSRFWCLRKHMNTMDLSKVRKGEVPFYSWECITL